MTKRQRITVVLGERMFTALRAASKRERRPQSEIVRMALEAHLGVRDDEVQYGGQVPYSRSERV